MSSIQAIYTDIQHIAIIPDGNRRWARSQGLSPEKGHSAGFDCTKKIILRSLEYNIPHLTFWGSSLSNMTKRSFSELTNLYFGFKKNFQTLLKEEMIHTHQVRVNVLGRWREHFPPDLVGIIDRLIRETEKYQQHTLNFLLAYSGDEEMLSAVQTMVAEAQRQDAPMNIDAQILKNHLYTRDLPPVDLLIRTGGEPHNSVGFMMWDVANAQYYFSELCYPDFSTLEFDKAVVEYTQRGRREGQ